MSKSSLEFKDHYFESYSGMLLDEDVLQDFLEVQEQDKIKKVITILIKRSLEDKKRIYKLLDILNEQSKRLDILEQYNKDKKTEFVNVSFESIEDIMNLFR
ncbi:hypothetical protein KLF32_06040 [Clostridium perfringens]|uniref:Uncharacterized protein n=1 Tax=Clostridium perfringens TaxID=1502 RepID=A0A2X2Y967_CLOPF|nr:hypothetical protein [Clostridium perfringens]ELC8344121.1 hypothetical protein [Clostridium perfringens]MDK0754813.1 hypothetical protein [Clostridium perfringens]MDK0758012.1 hypothetical protein [Clostridium perfringens]MDK0812065.1 hypothetical protein [Clostridium perfringens]MDM0714347.1 hypothetical protein [Clostridium perfringens]